MGDAASDVQAGVLPRAVRHVFESICADTSGSDFVLSCSYLEIYKEVCCGCHALPRPWGDPICASEISVSAGLLLQVVRDLLQPAVGGAKAPALMIREGRDKGVFVEGLTEVFVTGEDDILDCLSWCATQPSVLHPPAYVYPRLPVLLPRASFANSTVVMNSSLYSMTYRVEH